MKLSQKVNISLLILLCLFTSLFAQSKFEKVDGPLMLDTASLEMKYAWAGGLANPQFSEADINNDGILDLVIFERSEDRFLCFLNGGAADQVDYSYAFEYERNFPQDVTDWALLLDHNCDDVPDLFHSFEDGVAFRAGNYEENALHFSNSPTKLFDDFSEIIGIADTDIPAIRDITGDGFTDILTFNLSGGYVKLYENISDDCGGLDFAVTDECYGDFYETGITMSVTLNDDCEMGKPARDEDEKIHPGSTICAADITGNGRFDLLLGDVSFDNLVQLTIGDSVEEDIVIGQDTVYPSYNTSAIIPKFPAAFALDVNNDGAKDILVSPNNRVASEKTFCSWYYKNTATEGIQLELQGRQFLNDEMVEVGQYAHPRFVDYNNDGLTDLLIGNLSSSYFDAGEIGSVWLFENTGTAEQPEFTEVTNDFGKLTESFFTGMVPTMGDLNGDGELDMLLGSAGEVFSIPGDQNGIFIYLRGLEDSGNTGNFQSPLYVWQGLDVVQESSPQLFDVDGDGLLDIISGNRNGVIFYLKNIGTATDPIMELQSNFWGEVDVRNNLEGDSQPSMYRNAAGELRLAVGSANGQVFIYGDIENHIDGGAFELLDTMILEQTAGLNSSISVADINADGKMDMVVGNFRGGIEFFSESNPLIPGAIETHLVDYNIQIHPNPSDGVFYIHVDGITLKKAHLSVTDVAGRLIDFNFDSNTLQLNAAAQGIYFLYGSLEGIEFTRRLLVTE